jgi:hypothetical protein
MLGMVILNTASLEEAEQILRADPGVNLGAFGFEVHPVMLTDLSSVHMEYPK